MRLLVYTYVLFALSDLVFARRVGKGALVGVALIISVRAVIFLLTLEDCRALLVLQVKVLVGLFGDDVIFVCKLRRR